jgi:hypothetical protein
LVVQGGTNSIKGSNLGNFQLVSGLVTSDTPLTFVNFGVTGGELRGKAAITATTSTLGNAALTSATLTTQNIDVAGFFNLGGSSVTVTATGKVSSPAQFTMTNGATLTFASTCRFIQGNTFGLVPGGDPNPPLFTNNGVLNSTSSFSIVVNVRGTGTWNFAAGSALQVTGVIFNAAAGIVSSSWKFLGATASIGSLSGSGVVEVNGKQFLANIISLGTFNHLNGATQFDSGTVGTLNLALGQVNVTTTLAATTINFSSGTLAGTYLNQKLATVTATTAILTGNAPKFFANLNLYSPGLVYNCGNGGACQIILNNALIANKPQSVSSSSEKLQRSPFKPKSRVNKTQ